MTFEVSETDRDLFAREGYMILPGVIPADYLTLLREECSYFLGYMDARMDAGLVGEGALSVRRNRYFVNSLYRYSERLHEFLFSDLMAEVCKATIGDNAVLFNEQWVVKGAEQGMNFAWHQDSGYVLAEDPGTDHAPYVTCWCTLDDVNEENGTVYLLPHSTAGTRGKIIEHERDPNFNDLIGYRGDERGIALEVPAGSIVAFSSFNLHRSGANRSSKLRRVYLPQYASQPMVNSQTGAQMNVATPFLNAGVNVYDRATDTAERWGGLDVPA